MTTAHAPAIQSTPPKRPTASFKPRVRRLGPGRYLVESASKPGVGHPVTVDHCPCKGFAYRGMCSHVALVRAIQPAMERWYAQAAAPPAPAPPPAAPLSETAAYQRLLECFAA